MRLGRLREKCTMLCMIFVDTTARKLEKKYYAEEKTNQINKGDLIGAKMADKAKKMNSERKVEEYISKCRSEYKIVYMGELVRKEEIPNDD